MLDNFTLIVPTYNRPDFLERCLFYLDAQVVKFPILILDSSNDNKKELNLKIIKSFTQLQIKYVNRYYPDTFFYFKIMDGVDEIQTKYCAMCADDDFLIPNGIQVCIRFLENHPDYTTAGGFRFVFKVEKDKSQKKQFLWHGYPNIFTQCMPNYYKYFKLKSNNPVKRLTTHFSNYFETLYYIYRTDFLKMSFKENFKYNKEMAFGEVFLSMLTIIYGKVCTLPILYGAREPSNSTWAKEWDAYFRDGSIKDFYPSFRHGLVNNLVKVARIPRKKAGKIIDKGLTAYMQRFYGLVRFPKIWAIIGFVKTFSYSLIHSVKVDNKLKISFKRPKKFHTFSSEYLLPNKFYLDFDQLKQVILKFS